MINVANATPTIPYFEIKIIERNTFIIDSMNTIMLKDLTSSVVCIIFVKIGISDSLKQIKAEIILIAKPPNLSIPTQFETKI